MNNNIITIFDSNNHKKEYKLLFVIKKEYQYMIYTDIDNNSITKNLYALKVKEIKNNEKTIPINDDEWIMIENEYQNLLT